MVQAGVSGGMQQREELHPLQVCYFLPRAWMYPGNPLRLEALTPLCSFGAWPLVGLGWRAGPGGAAVSTLQ